MAGDKRMPIDNSALLYLSLLRKNHANTYRFSVTLREAVRPDVLQRAADNVFQRFPGIFAGFHPGFFAYSLEPVAAAPRVMPDTALLRTLSREEVHACPYRILYSGCVVSVEMFHALTDGYGAMATIRALIWEYLHLAQGVAMPEWKQNPEEEFRDAYLDHAQDKPGSAPNRSAYQLPGKDRNWDVKAECRTFSTGELLAAAKRFGVSLTALLSGIMAESIMELQQENRAGKCLPVRIMVPVDLRKLNPSGTLRNYILYALPTLEPEQTGLSRGERLQLMHEQLREQVTQAYLYPQAARNVRLQNAFAFRLLPRRIKCALTRLSYSFYGERNSSITLTNLGTVDFPPEVKPYIRGVEVHLTPRRKSPYNCALITYGNETRISITRFNEQPDFEELFFRKLRQALSEGPDQNGG